MGAELRVIRPDALTLDLKYETEVHTIAFVPDDPVFIKQFGKAAKLIGMSGSKFSELFKRESDNADNPDATINEYIETFEEMTNVLDNGIAATTEAFEIIDELFGAGTTDFVTSGVKSFIYVMPLFQKIGEMISEHAKERNKKIAPYKADANE
jgi:hypothetical protein